MGNFGKWLWGIIILIVVGLLVGWFAPAPWGAKANSVQMGKSVQAALTNGGFGWAKSTMSGNVATLEGTAPSEAAKNNAIAAAKNAQCEKCADRENGKRWHVVDGSPLKVKVALPIQKPFTLTGVLTNDGGVVLDGYVRNAKEKARLLADAEALFPGKVVDNKLMLARGAPKLNWGSVAKAHLTGLSKLESGQFALTDNHSLLSGKAASAAVRNAANSAIAASPTGFDVASKIDVPNVAPVVVGQLKDEKICQNLFAEIKGAEKIKFAFARAEIRDASSLALLDKLARAMKSCSTFNVSIEGHTDSIGNADSNLALSQNRAEAVVSALVARQVNVSQITAVGKGQTDPVATNTTSTGRAANRRIEFKITESK